MNLSIALRLFLVILILDEAFSRSTGLINLANTGSDSIVSSQLSNDIVDSLSPVSESVGNQNAEDMSNGIAFDTRDGGEGFKENSVSKSVGAQDTVGEVRILGSYGSAPSIGSQRINAGYVGNSLRGGNINMNVGGTRFGGSLNYGVGSGVMRSGLGYGVGTANMGSLNGGMINRDSPQEVERLYGGGVSRFSQGSLGRNFNNGDLYGGEARSGDVNGDLLRSDSGYAGSFPRMLRVNTPMWNQRTDIYSAPIMGFNNLNQPNTISLSSFRQGFGGYDNGNMGSGEAMRSGLRSVASNQNFGFQRSFYPSIPNNGMNRFSGTWRNDIGGYNSATLPLMSGLSNDARNRVAQTSSLGATYDGISSRSSFSNRNMNNDPYESSSLMDAVDTSNTGYNDNNNVLTQLGLRSNNKFDVNLLQSNSQPIGMVANNVFNGDSFDKTGNLYESSSLTGGLDDTGTRNTVENNYQRRLYTIDNSNNGYNPENRITSNINAVKPRTNFLFNTMSNRYSPSTDSNESPLKMVRSGYNPLNVGGNEVSLVNNIANQNH